MRERRRFTAAESAEIWDRWQRGEGLKLIGRVFGKHSSSIFAHLRPHGGIRPAPRRRSRRVLTLAEREEISRSLAMGASLRSIETSLGRAASTLSRELRRNGGRERYRAATSDRREWDRALRRKPCKLARQGPLRRIVADKLAQTWSPEQSLAVQVDASASLVVGASLEGRTLPVGCGAPLPTTRIIGCRTRRSIAACSSRSAAC